MLLFIGKPVATCSQQAYSLTLDELFRLGTENSLRLQASHMQEVVAADKKKTAQTARLPGISIGATTGYIGQSTVFRQGLTQPVHPDLPDWSHNYNVEVTQPVYRGGKIHYNIKRASLEKQIAALNSASSKAEVKLAPAPSVYRTFSASTNKKMYLPVTWKSPPADLRISAA